MRDKPSDFWRSVPDGTTEHVVLCRKGKKSVKLRITTVVANCKCSAYYWEGISFSTTEFNPEDFDDVRILESS